MTENQYKRVFITPFWKITNFGLSFWPLHHVFNRLDEFSWEPLRLIEKLEDPWGNKCISIIIPLIGGIEIFYNKTINRSTWFFSGMSNGNVQYMSPDFNNEANIPLERIREFFNFEIFHDESDDILEVIMETAPTISASSIKALVEQEGKIEQIG